MVFDGTMGDMTQHFGEIDQSFGLLFQIACLVD